VDAAADASVRHIHSVPIDATLVGMFLKSDLAADFASEIATIQDIYAAPLSTSYGQQLHAFFASTPGASGAATFKSAGKASDAVSFTPAACPTKCGASEVVIKMLAAPLSRSDLDAIETAQAKQGMKAKSIMKKSYKMDEYVYTGGASAKAGVAGNHGVGVVMQVGSGVSRLQAGDFVTPFKAGLGTWATDLVAGEADLAKLVKYICSIC
jgi:hypothetical protein